MVSNKPNILVPDVGAEDTAEFNSALALLKRINELEYEIESCLIHWDLRGAYSYLESYENELDFCFKDEEIKEVRKAKALIIKIFNECPQIGFVKKDARGNEMVSNAKIMPELRTHLITLNKLLRRLKHKYGMGMPKRGDGAMF